MIEFTIPGEPVPKARPRAAQIGGFVRIYTPKTTAKYENQVRAAARLAFAGTNPMGGPLRLRIDFTLPVPASWPKYRKREALAGLTYPSLRGSGDSDNLAKSILDGMNPAPTKRGKIPNPPICWFDDAQVTDLIVTKRYGAEPKAVVRLEHIAIEQRVAA